MSASESETVEGRSAEAAPGAGSRSPSSGFEIRVLGPVEISWDGRVVDIGGVKARALVARLLIDRNLVVSVDRLVDSLWGAHVGNGAEIALRSTISRLRKRLREAGASEDLIVTRAPGYMLSAPAEVTDVFRFERLVADGRRALARGRRTECTQLLREAEEMWRGSAYSEVRDEPFARAEARRLEELLLSATETRMDAGLTMGDQQTLVGDLETLTHANPMRERLWSQRMLALYRCGRQAEALRVFQDLRTILVDELGIEPGHDVTWMEQAILAHDPSLDYPVPPERSEAPPPVVLDDLPETREHPVLVPSGVGEGPLVGRDEESATLAEWWASARRSYARVLLVDGDSGIGKTRLVAELARQAESDGAVVLWGRCDEEPLVPFQPFAEAFSRYFQSMSADTISRMPEWQLSELSRLVVRLREYAPAFEGDRFRFFEAVTATLRGVAGRAPIQIVVDDLHWADQPTLLLLRHILRSFDRDNLGIVAVYIDTEVSPDHRLRAMLADFRADHRVDTVHLRGLSRDAVAGLMRDSGAPAGLVAELFVLTDGNPLFLDEMMRQLSYRDQAAADADTPVPPDLSPPEAIRELVARRVSRQPEDVIYLLQAAAVAGREFEDGIVAEAAELDPGRGLDALDQAEDSRLLRRVGGTGDRHAFTHALVREAIYHELLRGRRVRYHHKIAVATERAHAGDPENYVNELAHHFYLGAPLGDADKALRYCMAAGERSLHLLAFEEAVGHFQRGLELAEQYGHQDQAAQCDALIALAEAQNRAGDTVAADTNFERAAAMARSAGDAERLAAAALRAGPLSYLGIVGANAEQVRLLEEARSMLPEADSHLRAMVTARLGLVMVYAAGIPGAGVIKRSLALNSEAVGMARRLGDRNALGYALNARMHALWGIDPAPERLATGTELGEIAADVGDDLLALHGHMWRVRELLAQGDVDAVNEEVDRFAARDTGPVHPFAISCSYNVAAMMALVAGDFEEADRLGPLAMDTAAEYNEMAFSFYGALMTWTWWQRGDLTGLDHVFRDVIAQVPADYPVVRAALALVQAEAGDADGALSELDSLAGLGWAAVADDQTEGVSLALTAAACGVTGAPAAGHAANIYEYLRPYAGTAVVIRAPAAACVGPADQYLGLLATAMGDLALAEIHFEAALRLARRMRSAPFVAAAELELALVLRQRGRGEEEQVAVLLRHAEEAARQMGLHRMARRAAAPG
jgi:DNA-binding SARP family transcriptional activator/tetratricopeptide (TPR) repeat protein